MFVPSPNLSPAVLGLDLDPDCLLAGLRRHEPGNEHFERHRGVTDSVAVRGLVALDSSLEACEHHQVNVGTDGFVEVRVLKELDCPVG
jgi:hypothetical protein